MVIEDLIKCNINYANKAVILNTSNQSNEMIDTESIFIHKAIKKVNPKI